MMLRRYWTTALLATFFLLLLFSSSGRRGRAVAPAQREPTTTEATTTTATTAHTGVQEEDHHHLLLRSATYDENHDFSDINDNNSNSNNQQRARQLLNPLGMFDGVSFCMESTPWFVGTRTYEDKSMMLLFWQSYRLLGWFFGVRVFSRARSCEELCPCSSNGVCAQISADETSYECDCNDGFEFDGTNCTDVDGSSSEPTICGFPGEPCPEGTKCVEDPYGRMCPGAGCGGICVPICEGPSYTCPSDDLQCALDPNECEGVAADCSGLCVSRAQPFHPFCQGDNNVPCKFGFTCIDDPLDDCGVGLSRSCIGYCRAACGGIAGLVCPSGFVCVDDPNDACDPENGGADCMGLCYEYPPPFSFSRCGGSSNLQCRGGSICIGGCDTDVDAAGETCEGLCLPICANDGSGAECPNGTQCVGLPNYACTNVTEGGECTISACVPRSDPPHPFCQGDENAPCKYGYTCVEDERDDCAPDLVRSCIGFCQPVCRGFAGFQCPDNLVCVDDPNDDCNPQSGGSDCLGICIEPYCNSQQGIECPKGYTCQEHPECDGCNGICVDGDPSTTTYCGFSSGPCPSSLTACVDDPADDCDPLAGDTNCPEICLPIICNSQTGIFCPPGLQCDPHPSCRACNGICIHPPRQLKGYEQ